MVIADYRLFALVPESEVLSIVGRDHNRAARVLVELADAVKRDDFARSAIVVRIA